MRLYIQYSIYDMDICVDRAEMAEIYRQIYLMARDKMDDGGTAYCTTLSPRGSHYCSGLAGSRGI
jgi:hypothetical protein